MRILLTFLFAFIFYESNSQILEKEFIYNRNKKAFEFYENYLDKTENQVISPFFIDFAFTSVYAATKSGTASQVSDFMIFDKDWNEHSKKMLEYQKIITENNRLNTYFSYSINFFIEDSLKILNEFPERISSFIVDSVKNVDFTEEKNSIALVLNNYLSNKTSDFCNEMFSSDNIPDNPNILINSFAYYNGFWANDFKNKYFASFFQDSTTIEIENVQYLTTLDYYKYGETEDYQIIEIPYEGYEFTLIVFLPRKVKNLSEFEKIFTFDSYLLWRQMNLQTQLTRLIIPKFEVKSLFTFKSSIDTVVPAIFSLGGNFLNLICKVVKISEIYHYSIFNVKDENSEPEELKNYDFDAEMIENESVLFNINRPFIFLLVHTKSEAIIYMGHIYNPLF